MNSNFRNLFDIVVSSKIHLIPVRYRYYADKIARGPISKKFGYRDKLFQSGPLPRLKDAEPLPIPIHRPGNAWSREKVTRGQNDYIDILGGGRLKPPEVSYEVPKWLRGRKGNEIQLLSLKSKVVSSTLYEYENPTMMESMRRRFKYLYRFLNRKTKTGFSPKQ